MGMISQAARIHGDPAEELSHTHGKRGITSASTRMQGGAAIPAPALLRGSASAELKKMLRMPCAGERRVVLPLASICSVVTRQRPSRTQNSSLSFISGL